ncbi:MAG TPA: (d)CMP kinase [Candidatus Methylomirabilis sp.]|nr:(d)CMP kinase [Candidatus Methylomirabilis sp.]
MRLGGGRGLVITIDGPAGAGKSTVARELARRLGLSLVSTGALYRALAWAVREAHVALDDERALQAVLDRTTVNLAGSRVLVNGRDVSDEILTPEIAALTSELTQWRPVRDKMTPLQRELAAPGGVVLEGRDTGTVVWPEAEVKFYLDADLDARAARRQGDLRAQGIQRDLVAVKTELAARDRQDMTRALAPLVVPDGATVVDSTDLTTDEVVERMIQTVEQVWCCIRS